MTLAKALPRGHSTLVLPGNKKRQQLLTRREKEEICAFSAIVDHESTSPIADDREPEACRKWR